MARGDFISIPGWRMSRLAFQLYIALLAICALGFVSMDAFGIYLPRGETYLWLGAALLLLILPLVCTMRFRDMGRSILWPLLTVMGVLAGFAFLLSSLASISGTPGGGSGPSTGERVMTVFVSASFALLALITLAGLILPSKSALSEVPQ